MRCHQVVTGPCPANSMGANGDITDLLRASVGSTEASNGRLAHVGLIARRGGGPIDFGFSGQRAHEQRKVTHRAATAISQ